MSSKSTTEAVEEVPPVEVPRSVKIASGGIYDSRHLRNFQAALLADTMTGAVSVKVCNASCNVMGKMLKTSELEIRYGGGTDTPKPIELADRPESEKSALEAERAALIGRLAELEAIKAKE